MKSFLLLVVLVLLAVIPPVSAQFLDVSVEPDRMEVFSSRVAEFPVTITNNRDSDDVFVISASGDRIEWRNPRHLLVPIKAFGSYTVYENYFVFRAEPGEYNFKVTVASFYYPEIRESASFTIEVLPPFFLTSLSSVREGDAVTARLEGSSKDPETVEVAYEVFGPEGNLVAKHAFSEEFFEDTVVQRRIEVPSHSPPGEYSLKATAKGESVESAFTVPVVRGLVRSEETISTTWYDEVVISVTNGGNVEEVFKTQELTSTNDALTGMVAAPTGCIEDQSGRSCSYEVLVPPGQTREIRYRLEFWPTFAKMGAGVLMVGILGVFAVRRQTKPKIRKRYRMGRKHTSIMLSVKNSYGKTNSVVVRDWVSPLATVVMEEFEVVRPVVRRSDAGTEMIWNLGDMSSGEERLVSYKIKPMIHGNLKMPSASLRYKRGGGEATRVRSNSITIE